MSLTARTLSSPLFKEITTINEEHIIAWHQCKGLSR